MIGQLNPAYERLGHDAAANEPVPVRLALLNALAHRQCGRATGSDARTRRWSETGGNSRTCSFYPPMSVSVPGPPKRPLGWRCRTRFRAFGSAARLYRWRCRPPQGGSPEPPDMAVIAIPAAGALDAVCDCQTACPPGRQCSSAGAACSPAFSLQPTAVRAAPPKALRRRPLRPRGCGRDARTRAALGGAFAVGRAAAFRPPVDR